MDKPTVARILGDIAALIELGEPNPYRARAFERASREVEKLDTDIVDLVESGKLYDTPGIGKAIGKVIEEIVHTGRSNYFEDLQEQYPPGVFELQRVPGLGLRKIGQLYSELGIASLDDLEKAARAGRLTRLRGFGPKMQQKILGGIAIARSRTSQFLLPAGIEAGETIREHLAEIDQIDDAEISGSVRRRLEIVRNVDIAVASHDIEGALSAIERRSIVDRFERVDASTARGIVRNEIEARFHLSKPEDFGATLLRTTGSAEFVAAFERQVAHAGFELRNDSLYKKGRHLNARTEQELFDRVGIAFVEPERREDAAELARKRRSPLIQPNDLRGTFHVHTTWSDGRNTVAEMLSAARECGFEYVGISDHSKSAIYASGLSEAQVRRQHAEIDRYRDGIAPMRIFVGTEADILRDGSVDYSRDTLGRFDFVIASIHSRFGMGKEEMTARILRAIDDPFVTFIGHLTGRLLLSREGYAVDHDRIFERAGERGVMIEINGSPRRLDVDWRHIRRALDRGVVLSIHPDAHSIAEMQYIVTGTWVARKAGLSPKHVFNVRPLEEVEEYLTTRRERAIRAVRQ